MPGYFVHFGCANPAICRSILGRKGLIAPDFFKWEIPTKEQYEDFFANCKGEGEIPTYEEICFVCDESHGRTHFSPSQDPGDTNHADFDFLKTAFESGKLKYTDFWWGFIHHLRTDYEFYANPSICDMEKFDADYNNDSKSAMDTLHEDWDKTNGTIAKWYPEVASYLDDMPENVRNIVKFTQGETVYINIHEMTVFMDMMRQERSIDELLNWNS